MAFTFSDRYDTENYDATLIVDALNLCFRWKHTNKFDNYKYDFEKTVESIANSYKCGNIIICADWGKSAYRKAIYPNYKADRAERFKDQTDEEKEQFEKFFAEYEATLELLKEKYLVLRYKNVEADDIAAHLVLHREQYELNDIWLLSSDGDWDLLIDKGVHRFSWRARKEITCENWYEHYEVTPEEFISYKCLMGDKSDNIPGVHGVGPKRAAGLIKDYGSALDIHDALPLAGTASYIKNLNESAEQLLTNYELMDLLTYCDDAIGEENLKDIRLQMGDVPW
jgi:5'-3' exonuclease